MKKRLFSIITIAYILSILLLPRLIPEKAIGQIWNPYSLLHIPLYGTLMGLLTFTFLPKPDYLKSTPFNPSSLLLPGGIATFIGILDEINQIFIPYRNASITDVLLDMGGVALAGLAIFLHQSRKRRMSV